MSVRLRGLVLGLGKGAIIGASVGLIALRLGLGHGWGYVMYGLIGLVVGLVCGRPVWSHIRDAKSTVWTSIIKGVCGVGVGVGLFVLVNKTLGSHLLALGGEARPVTDWPHLFGTIVGMLYGAWVELDDPPMRNDPDGGTPGS